jgi:hypothetical protein
VGPDGERIALSLVAEGRMQELGGKRVWHSWSQVELDALKRAVALHGRDWAAVASSVGSKTRLQCWKTVEKEVAAGRMQEPGGKHVHDSWNDFELGALKRAVAQHGRDWAAVSSQLHRSKTRQQCKDKVKAEVAAGRMQKPARKCLRVVERDRAAQAQEGRGPARSQLGCRLTRCRQQVT